MLIVHASDLTGDDAGAFVHAAALARDGARVITVHAGSAGDPALPGASELAARWGRPIDHELRRIAVDDDLADDVIEAIRQLRPEIVVVGTHARHGLATWVRGSVSEAIARNLQVPVLVVPNRSRGFVDPRDGTIDLRRILIPAGRAEAARRGAEAARSLARLAGCAGELELVHAGAVDPELERLGFPIVRIDGVLEDGIITAARRRDARLIVMATRGHDGIADLLHGSHTERVIREADCPVLSVPDLDPRGGA
jgi:nucleotide-binding universal stress UspA family protein